MKIDIIAKALQEYPDLQPHYDYWIEPFSEDGEINFGTYLNCFSSAIISSLNENKIKLISLKSILDRIEYTLVEHKKRDELDTLGVYEVMFFENILNWISNIQDEEKQSYYSSFFEENLGPISKELCMKNNNFWREVIISKNTRNSL